MSVTYTAVLPVRDQTVDFLAGLLSAARVRLGTRTGTRCLSSRDQAILVLRWFCDAIRVRQLARDNGISKSTCYDYLHEGIDVLAAQAPSLHHALLAAKAAGYSHVIIDGTLIETDRVAAPGPTPGVDLWWSGRHTLMAATSRWFPCRTGGRSGPRRSGPAGSTTPPPYACMSRSCPPSPRPSAICVLWATCHPVRRRPAHRGAGTGSGLAPPGSMAGVGAIPDAGAPPPEV